MFSWFVSWLVGWSSVSWLVGLLVGWLVGWLFACSALLRYIAFFTAKGQSPIKIQGRFVKLACVALLFAYSSRLFDFDILPDPNSFNFQFTGKSFVKLKLSMIFLEATPSG